MTSLVLSNRFYDYIKKTAITGCTQAFVELITNADDAYINGGVDERDIKIYLNFKTRILKVIDQATGLTPEKMQTCFGQVGIYTATEVSRGYFSKGAKDVSALGDVYFTSIKDGVISQCLLTYGNLFSYIIEGRNVTNEERQKYEITENGLHVELKIRVTAELPDISRIIELYKYFSLRDIFTREKTKVNAEFLNSDGEIFYDDRMFLNKIDTTVLVDEVIKINDFYDENGDPITAHYVIEYIETPEILDIEHEELRQNGIFLSSNNTIHDVTTFYNDIKHHPKIKHIIGRLECAHINHLMLDYDKGNETIMNPFPIFDHSRLYGVDKKHPFIKKLYDIPYKHLKFILQDLYDKENLTTKKTVDISALFKNSELWISKIFEEMAQYMFSHRLIDKEKIYSVLKSKQDNIIESKETEYDLDKLESVQEEQHGNLKDITSNLDIVFIESDDVEPYKIFTHSNNFVVEYNIRDYSISQYFEKKEDEKIYALEGKKDSGNLLLTNLLCEALARELIKFKAEYLDNTNNLEYFFKDYHKLRNTLVEPFYRLISTIDIND